MSKELPVYCDDGTTRVDNETVLKFMAKDYWYYNYTDLSKSFIENTLLKEGGMLVQMLIERFAYKLIDDIDHVEEELE